MTRERDIERALVKAVKAKAGLIRKLGWIGRVGAPDRMVMLPTWLHPRFIELKAPGGRLAKIQIVEHKRMRAAGLDVRVVWKVEQIAEALS